MAQLEQRMGEEISQLTTLHLTLESDFRELLGVRLQVEYFYEKGLHQFGVDFKKELDVGLVQSVEILEPPDQV